MEQHIPKVSVIIPVYNVEPFLRECLESVINQTMRDIEIICVDDGSTDGSPTILEEYRQKDARITVITQQNLGQSAARNRGLDVACGDYIYFIDSDDYVELELLEKTSALSDEMNLDVLVFGMDQFLETDNINPDLSFEIKAKENSPEVLTGVKYIRWSKDNEAYPTVAVAELWRRSFLTDNSLRFKEGIIYEDPLFSFQCFMAAKRVFQITDIFYHYRRWENSTTLKPISHKNVEAYFGCAYGMLAYAFRESNTPEENYAILCAYEKYSWLTSKYYHALSAGEKAKIVLPDELQKNLFRQIIINNSVTDKEYRFFRAITWLPRKILIRYRKFRKLVQISKLNHRKQ